MNHTNTNNTKKTSLRVRKRRAATGASTVQRPAVEDQDESEPKKIKVQTYKRYQTIVQSINTAVQTPFVKTLDHAARQIAATQYLGSKLFAMVISHFLDEDRSSFELTNQDYNAWKATLPRPERVRGTWKPVKDPEKTGLIELIRRSFTYVSKRHYETATFAAERKGRSDWDVLWPDTDDDDNDKRPDLLGLTDYVTSAAKNYYECLERHTTIRLFGHMVKYVTWKHPEWAKMAEKVVDLLWNFLGGCYRDAPRRKLVAMGKLRMPVANLDGVDPRVIRFLEQERSEFKYSLGTMCQQLHYMRRILLAFENWNTSRSGLPVKEQRLVKVFALVPDVKMAVGFFDINITSLKTWSTTKRLNLPQIQKWEDFFDPIYIQKHRKKDWSLAGEHRIDGVQVHVLLEKED